MLGETSVHTTLPARWISRRAKKWYQEKLGLTRAEETAAGVR